MTAGLFMNPRKTGGPRPPLQTMSAYLISDFNVDLRRDLFLIAGPCVIESREHCFFMARELQRITSDQGIQFVFKASFDKANRTSIKSFRGPGPAEGLKILAEI